MAFPGLLRSTASLFRGRSLALSAPPVVAWGLRYPSAPLGFTARAFATVSVDTPCRLQTIYRDCIVPLLIGEFSYQNIYQVPKIDKVVVSSGREDPSEDKKSLEAAVLDMECITGQKPLLTGERVVNPNFKLQNNDPVGLVVTLRGSFMYSFLDRLINSIDGVGNYSIAMREQDVFPEIKFDVFGKAWGMDVCITAKANTNREAHRLLALMGMPFKLRKVVGSKRKFQAHHFRFKI